MEKQQEVNKLFNKTYIFLIIISFVTAMGFSMVYTMIVDYATNTIGSSLSVAGIVSGVFSITALCVRPFGGMASDIYNKKNICIISTALIGVAALGYMIAPNIIVLLIFRILHGAAFGISGTSNIALVSRFIPKKRMGEGIGYYGLGQVLAMAIGPGIGDTIESYFGYNVLFLVISLITFLAVFLLTRVRYTPEKVVVERNKKGKIKISLDRLIAKEILMYAIVAGIFSFGNGIVNSFLKVMSNERGIKGYAIFFTINAIVLFGVRLIAGRLADKKGLTLIVNISLIASMISMTMLGYAKYLYIVLAAAVFNAVGRGGGQLSLQAECIKRVDENKTGVATSTFYIGADIGQGIGPVIGGVIASKFSYQATFLTTAFLIIATMAMFNIYQKKQSVKNKE